jgi:hypothetical protein
MLIAVADQHLPLDPVMLNSFQHLLFHPVMFKNHETHPKSLSYKERDFY